MKLRTFTIIQLFILGACFLGGAELNAQRNCGAMEVLEKQLQDNPEMGRSRQAIEAHTAQYISSNKSAERGLIKIPVVFHIVWRTNAPAENISDAQIQSQIDALNKDFSLLNADASKIPSVFKINAANIGIQFELAKRTPWGAMSNGINHYQSSRTTFWGANDDIKKSDKGGVAPWDTKKYLNVWVCAIGSNILGYAQFPGGPAASDGIVIDYQCVGVNGTSRAPFNLGRTMTHEVGHWLNLYHIWGNGTCGDDLISDTPMHTEPSYGCPTFPQVNTCSANKNVKMTMNFMDYTNDQCMFMFTNGQKSRIHAMFAPGGARESLVLSDALVAGAALAKCETPTITPVTNLLSNSATVNWLAPTGANSFVLRYKTRSGTTWTSVSLSKNAYNITNLLSNTEYEYQVQSNCYGTPGSYSASNYFKTPLTSSCGTPQTINVANISHNSATISWSAISGATQYRFQFKRATSSTWNVYTLTATTCKLNIAANTNYQVQVAAICGGTLGAFTSVKAFTTLVAPPVCSDAYETVPNNTQTTASKIVANAAISATIGSSTDSDWYVFSNSATQPHIQITLSNLKVNYGLRLYSNAGVLLTQMDKIGTSNEVIQYNNGMYGAYYVQVYNNAGSNDPYNCYALIANTSSTPYVSGGKEGDLFEDEIETISEENDASIVSYELGKFNSEQVFKVSKEIKELSFKVFPNPVSNNAVLNIETPEEENQVTVMIFDAVGRIVYENQIEINPENNKVVVNMSEYQNGLYLVRVMSKTMQQVQKIIVRK